MNEWSPTGNHSGPGGFYQTGRPLRSQWDEYEKGTKLLAVNIRTMAESRHRSFQQHITESVSKTSLTASNKLGGGNGISDPRFKRVITPGVQNDVCVGTEAKTPKASIISDGKEAPLSKLSVWKAPESKPKKSWVDSIKNSDQSKNKLQDVSEPPCEKLNAAEDFNFDQSQDNFKAVDMLSFNHDIIVKSDSKESLSACTANTKNSSVVPAEFGDDLSNPIKVPSATRLKKVQHWMYDQISKPEKKHSVITVIGQMQDPENLSSAFQEIDKRRKLVKELDKYAVCKKIIEPDLDKKEDFSDSTDQVDTLNSDKGLITSASNETLNYYSCVNSKVSKKKSNKYSTASSREKNLKSCDDTVCGAVTQNQYFSVRNKVKKCKSSLACILNGLTVSSLSYQKLFCILIITTGILCWFAFTSIQKGTLLAFELFNTKPKPITWYEKLCQWLWELFRPSANYRRTKMWRSF